MALEDQLGQPPLFFARACSPHTAGPAAPPGCRVGGREPRRSPPGAPRLAEATGMGTNGLSRHLAGRSATQRAAAPPPDSSRRAAPAATPAAAANHHGPPPGNHAIDVAKGAGQPRRAARCGPAAASPHLRHGSTPRDEGDRRRRDENHRARPDLPPYRPRPPQASAPPPPSAARASPGGVLRRRRSERWMKAAAALGIQGGCDEVDKITIEIGRAHV